MACQPMELPENARETGQVTYAMTGHSMCPPRRRAVPLASISARVYGFGHEIRELLFRSLHIGPAWPVGNAG